MKNRQFAVIGLGRFGSSVAVTLSSLGYDVLAIDSSEQQVQAIANEVTHAVQVDALDENALKALGIRNFDVVIVAMGDDIQANILVTVILKEIGVKYVISKAKNSMHGKVLAKVGADKVVYPEKDMGIRIAYHLVSENILDFIELSPDYSIIEVVTPPEFAGKSIGNLNLRAKYGISVLAIKKKDEIVADPGADSIIDEKDILVFVGKNTSLSYFPHK
ncbi:MAG: Ktr system potassium uptake protein A [Candidatus Dichloromethanomonas elyunquensis]|nr:MAG: Ktr system potassium uptake protein A [Candidatus Dichloromethanomonas elyunquensis]